MLKFYFDIWLNNCRPCLSRHLPNIATIIKLIFVWVFTGHESLPAFKEKYVEFKKGKRYLRRTVAWKQSHTAFLKNRPLQMIISLFFVNEPVADINLYLFKETDCKKKEVRLKLLSFYCRYLEPTQLCPMCVCFRRQLESDYPPASALSRIGVCRI